MDQSGDELVGQPPASPGPQLVRVTQLTGDHVESFPEIRIRGKNKSGGAHSSCAASEEANGQAVAVRLDVAHGDDTEGQSKNIELQRGGLQRAPIGARLAAGDGQLRAVTWELAIGVWIGISDSRFAICDL